MKKFPCTSPKEKPARWLLRWLCRAALSLLVMLWSLYVIIFWASVDIPPNLSEAPGKIRNLATLLPGKPDMIVRLIFWLKFGAPDRIAGSGLLNREWILPEGTLRLHDGLGPSFKSSTSHKHFWLLKSANPLGECLHNHYSLQVRVPYRSDWTTLWVGEMDLHADGSYNFEDRCLVPKGMAKPVIFFTAHPKGTFTVKYNTGRTAHTLLESLPQVEPVARLAFSALDDGSSMDCSLDSNGEVKVLIFGQDGTPPFFAYGPWKDR